MKVSIEQEYCIGCCMCVSVEPSVFKFNKTDGVAQVFAQPSKEVEARVREIIEGCPAQVIEET